MKTFKEYIFLESSIQRKIEDGSGETAYDIPGTDVVHHDPEKKLTVYHMKTPKSCYILGSGTSLCTNTKNKSFAHDYLRKGNLFMIHHGDKRHQTFFTKDKESNDEGPLSDWATKGPLHKVVGDEVITKMRNLPHATPDMPKWLPDMPKNKKEVK